MTSCWTTFKENLCYWSGKGFFDRINSRWLFTKFAKHWFTYFSPIHLCRRRMALLPGTLLPLFLSSSQAAQRGKNGTTICAALWIKILLSSRPLLMQNSFLPIKVNNGGIIVIVAVCCAGRIIVWIMRTFCGLLLGCGRPAGSRKCGLSASAICLLIKWKMLLIKSSNERAVCSLWTLFLHSEHTLDLSPVHLSLSPALMKI